MEKIDEARKLAVSRGYDPDEKGFEITIIGKGRGGKVRDIWIPPALAADIERMRQTLKRAKIKTDLVIFKGKGGTGLPATKITLPACLVV